jgi:hypothetical protein
MHATIMRGHEAPNNQAKVAHNTAITHHIITTYGKPVCRSVGVALIAVNTTPNMRGSALVLIV